MARAIPDKIAALEHMLRVIPKHKGTDRLQGDLKRKLAKLKGQAQRSRATARHGDEHHIDREGAGQIALLGLPNVERSVPPGLAPPMLRTARRSARPMVALAREP